MSNLGFVELLLIFGAVGVLFGAKYLSTAGQSMGRAISDGKPSWQPFVADPTRAWPDVRYAQGVRTGELGELFGIGVRGVRMPQVIVLYFATLLSDNIDLVRWANDLGSMSPESALYALARPAVFLLSAIIAIRSFQGFVTIAVVTAILYTVLWGGLLFAVAATISSFASTGDPSLVRPGVSSFVWPVLTMMALQIGLLRNARWLRIGIGLTVAGALQLVLNVWMYRHRGYTLELETQVPQVVVAALAWTAGFWIAQKWFGETPASFSLSEGESSSRGLSRAEWLIPLAIIVFGVALMLLT